MWDGRRYIASVTLTFATAKALPGVVQIAEMGGGRQSRQKKSWKDLKVLDALKTEEADIPQSYVPAFNAAAAPASIDLRHRLTACSHANPAETASCRPHYQRSDGSQQSTATPW